MHPSLDIPVCSTLVAKEIANGDLKFEGVEWQWATIYIALNMSKNAISREKLGHVIPSRLREQGKRPTVKTYWTDEKKVRWKWRKAIGRYTDQDQRRVMQKVLEIMVRTTFKTHFHNWDSKIKLQVKGGAIGLRVAESMSRIVMDVWIKRFLALLESLGFKIHL